MQKFESLGLMCRYKEISKVFSILAHVKLVTPKGGAKFDPRALISALLVEANYIGLHAKLGKPRPYG